MLQAARRAAAGGTSQTRGRPFCWQRVALRARMPAAPDAAAHTAETRDSDPTVSRPRVVPVRSGPAGWRARSRGTTDPAAAHTDGPGFKGRAVLESAPQPDGVGLRARAGAVRARGRPARGRGRRPRVRAPGRIPAAQIFVRTPLHHPRRRRGGVCVKIYAAVLAGLMHKSRGINPVPPLRPRSRGRARRGLRCRLG